MIGLYCQLDETRGSRQGQYARPSGCDNREKNSRIAFASSVRELDLDTEPSVSNRAGPPSLRSNTGRR
jgi:hypothetical protein